MSDRLVWVLMAAFILFLPLFGVAGSASGQSLEVVEAEETSPAATVSNIALDDSTFLASHQEEGENLEGGVIVGILVVVALVLLILVLAKQI